MAAVDVGVLFVKNIQVVCLSVQVAVVEIRRERKGKIGVVAQTLTLMVRSSFSGTFPRTIEALRSPPRRLCPTSSYVHSCRIAAKICLDNHLHIIHPPLPNDCVHMERRGALCVVSRCVQRERASVVARYSRSAQEAAERRQGAKAERIYVMATLSPRPVAHSNWGGLEREEKGRATTKKVQVSAAHGNGERRASTARPGLSTYPTCPHWTQRMLMVLMVVLISRYVRTTTPSTLSLSKCENQFTELS